MCFLRISLPQRTLAAQPRFWIRTRFLSGKSSLVPFIWYFGAMRSQRGQSGRGWEWASANTYLLVTNRLLDVVRAVGKKTNFMWHIPSSIHQELWWVMNADVFSSQTKVIYIYVYFQSLRFRQSFQTLQCERVTCGAKHAKRWTSGHQTTTIKAFPTCAVGLPASKSTSD